MKRAQYISVKKIYSDMGNVTLSVSVIIDLMVHTYEGHPSTIKLATYVYLVTLVSKYINKKKGI